MENSLENYALAIHPSMSLFRDLEQELLDEADRILGENSTTRSIQDVEVKDGESDLADLFELKETPKSYMRKKIPTYCQILLPFDEERPYISALVTDENLDDDQNHFARILSKEIEDELNDELDSTNSVNEEPMET